MESNLKILSPHFTENSCYVTSYIILLNILLHYQKHLLLTVGLTRDFCPHEQDDKK